MSRRHGRCLVVACLLATAVLAAAGPAHATGPIDLPAAMPAKLRSLVRARMHLTKPPRRTWESRFEIETEDGYKLTVIGLQGVVAVVVTRGSGSRSSGKGSRGGAALTGYVGRGTVAPGRIEASLGRFGRIAVRFRPSGRIVKSRPRRRCKGPDRYTIRPGVFVGSIRFTGENRYVQVRAHRAKGRIRRPLQLRCSESPSRLRTAIRGRPVGSFPSFSVDSLQAGWRDALASTELIALRFGKRVFYVTSAEESLGSVAEVHFAVAFGPSRAFVVNEALTSARLRPPWPFRGTGSYEASPDGTRTWSGGLRAAFPGAPRFPLAGPRFRARLESSL